MITSRNNDPRWILATIVKSRNRQFWGWHKLFYMKFYWLHFSEYVLYCTWNQNFFFRFCAGKFSSAAPTIMDARSSLRWLSSSDNDIIMPSLVTPQMNPPQSEPSTVGIRLFEAASVYAYCQHINVLKHFVSLYRGDKILILRLFVSLKFPFTTKIV